MAKMSTVRSRLKAPETLEGKKNECTEEVEELQRQKNLQKLGVFWFACFFFA